MRVIAGSARGRPLKAPEGLGTRPMTDRIKESLFNILGSMGFPQEGDRVLDLYAGTGSLGIEALSRGAAWADFVEQNAKVAAITAANLSGSGLGKQGKVHNQSVRAFLSRPNFTISDKTSGDAVTYDIILLDPPYADPEIVDTLLRVATSGLLHKEGIIVLGHARQVEPGDSAGELIRVRHRLFGGSAFSIYRHPNAAAAAADDEAEPEPKIGDVEDETHDT